MSNPRFEIPPWLLPLMEASARGEMHTLVKGLNDLSTLMDDAFISLKTVGGSGIVRSSKSGAAHTRYQIVYMDTHYGCTALYYAEEISLHSYLKLRAGGVSQEADRVADEAHRAWEALESKRQEVYERMRETMNHLPGMGTIRHALNQDARVKTRT